MTLRWRLAALVGLQLLDAALQVLPHRLELGLELPYDRLVVLARRAHGARRGRRLVDERDEEQPSHLARPGERLHRDPYSMPPVDPANTRIGGHRSLAVVDGLADGAAKPGLQPGTGPRHQVLGGRTGWLAQILLRRPREEEDLVPAVDQHARRDEALDQRLQGQRAEPAGVRSGW
jgi:hypothetical protein